MASGILAHLLHEVVIRRAALAAAVLALLAVPAAAQGQNTTTICHATGDPNAPYQQLDVTAVETLEHLNHPDDIVPAPAGGCPATALAPDPEDTPAPAAPVPTATVVPTATPKPDRVPGPSRRPRRRRPRANVAPVAPATARFTPHAGSAPAAVSNHLPMTGDATIAVLLTGLGFVMAGLGTRLRYVER